MTRTAKPQTREEWAALLETFPEEIGDLLISAGQKMRGRLYPGGRTPVLKPCPKCGEMFSARELRIHTPKCGAHLVPCKYCGQTSSAFGTTLHEAICKRNPNRKSGRTQS